MSLSPRHSPRYSSPRTLSPSGQLLSNFLSDEELDTYSPKKSILKKSILKSPGARSRPKKFSDDLTEKILTNEKYFKQDLDFLRHDEMQGLFNLIVDKPVPFMLDNQEVIKSKRDEIRLLKKTFNVVNRKLHSNYLERANQIRGNSQQEKQIFDELGLEHKKMERRFLKQYASAILQGGLN